MIRTPFHEEIEGATRTEAVTGICPLDTLCNIAYWLETSVRDLHQIKRAGRSDPRTEGTLYALYLLRPLLPQGR